MHIYKGREFIVAEITQSQRMFAELEYKSRFEKSNIVNGHTVYNRKRSRLAGILGELVFAELYPDAQKSKRLGYDFIRDGKRIDVKCKCRNYPPRITDQASVFDYQDKDQIDIYYFMSTTPQFEKVWLCGWIGKEELLNHMQLERWLPGQVDHDNGMRFRSDTIALKYQYLHPILLGKLVRDPVR